MSVSKFINYLTTNIMRNFRRMVATLSVVAILSSLLVSATAFAQTFTDVSANDYYYASVEGLSEIGVVDASKGTYEPARSLQRQEAAKLVVEAAGLVADVPTEGHFTDVPTTLWSYASVETAFANSVVSGYSHLPGYFGPTDIVTREQFAKMVVQAFDLPEYMPNTATFPDVTPDMWSYSFVETAYYYGVINGNPDGTFAPSAQINRADGAVMTWQALSSEGVPPVDEPPVVDAVPGELTVEISATTPSGVTLPSGATSVEVATWDFTTGDNPVTITSLDVHKFGVASLPTSHQVYLYDGMDRLTSGKSVNSTTNLASFNSLNYTVAKNSTASLTLRLDTGTVSATGEIGFELENAAAVNVGASTVGGSFPASGEMFGLSTTAAGVLTVETNGTVANPKVGEDGVTIAKFKMSAATEAGSLEQFGLYVSGSISTDAVENLKLYVSGTTNPIAEVAGLNTKDVAAFVLDTPYEIAKGDTKAFWVTADLNTGRSADTIKAYIDESSDVVAIGGTYGFGMSLTTTTYDGGSCTTSAGDCTFSTVEGGDITVSSNGPVATDVAIAGNDVVLADFSIVSVSDLVVKNWPISLTASESADTTEGLLNGTASNFTDIKIVNADTGATLMGPIDSDVLTTALAGTTAIGEHTATDGDAGDTDDDIAYYLFTDEFNMAAGEELNLALTADVANTATLDGMTVYGTLNLGSTYPEMRDVNNKVITNSSTLVPASSITGKTMTVSSPAVELALAAVPVAGATTKIKGEQDVQFVGVSVKCGAASDCLVTDVALTSYIDDTGATTFVAGQDTANNSVYVNEIVGSVWLEDGNGNVVGASKGVQSSGTVTYSSTNLGDGAGWLIPAGETEIMYVVGDLSSSAYKNSNGESVSFAIAAGGISYEDDDGNTRTSTGAVNGTTSPTTYVLTSNGGSLTVAVDASTTKEDIVVAGTTGNEISKFKFTTTDEAFLVKKLSINARQSAATTAALGDYDNNVQKLTLSYTNSLGVTETKAGYLTKGTATFSGLDMLVAKDDDAILTVMADTNTISNGATAAEFIDLNIGFNNFEAVAQASGETYNGSKIDSDVAAASDLDFGTVTWTNGSHNVNLAVAALASLGTAQELKVDDGAAATPENLPVGTLLCVSADTTCDDTAETIMVVTAWTEGTVWTDGVTGDTVATVVLNNADTAFANDDNIVYALPGTGYLTGAKQMHVYEAKPAVTLAASSPSGSRTVAASDNAFVFSVEETSGVEKVQIRKGLDITPATVGVGTLCTPTADTDAGDNLDGSGTLCTTAGNTAADTFVYDAGAAGILDDYSRVNFWIKWTDAAAVASPTFTDLAVGYGLTSAVTAPAATVALSQTACGADAASLVTTEWYNCDLAIAPASTHQYFHFVLVEATELLATDLIHVDAVKLYNEKVVVDIATDADLDTYANNTSNAAAPSETLLKEGGSTVATAYWDTTTNGASATSTGKAVFIPTTADIDVSKGTTKTFTVTMDSSDLLHEDAGSDDPVTLSVALGSSTDGTVTAGGFWWYETNAIVKWLGQVSDTTLNGNTLKY